MRNSNSNGRPGPSSSPEVGDRLPPHSPEGEAGVIGSILWSGARAVELCVRRLRAGGEEFYDLRNQSIYQTMVELWTSQKPPDMITVQNALKDKGLLDQCGGVIYLSDTQDAVPVGSDSSLPAYLDIVVEKYQMRQTVRVCTDVVSRIYDFGNETGVDALIDECEQRVLSIRPDSARRENYVDITTTIQRLVEEYDDAALYGAPMGISTGFVAIDAITGGMMPGEMIVLSGLRSSGKTTLALNIAYNSARKNTKVGVLSLETTGKSLTHRLLANLGRYNGFDVMRGQGGATTDQIVGATLELNAVRDNLLIQEEGGMTDTAFQATCRRMVRDGAKLLIVDYLQLLETPGKSQYERTTAASRLVKKVCQQIGVPILAVASMNREGGKKDIEPKVEHLRDSGQIDYDANKIWFVHQLPDEDQDLTKPFRRIKFIAAKGKDSGEGVCELLFFKSQFRMASVNKGKPDESDIPDTRQRTFEETSTNKP